MLQMKRIFSPTDNQMSLLFWKRDGTGAKKLVGNMKSFGDFDALFISVFSVA